MVYTTKQKIDLLQRNKKIYKIVIKECTKKLPMYEMSYPGCIETNYQGKPIYSSTKDRLRGVIKNIDKMLKELKSQINSLQEENK